MILAELPIRSHRPDVAGERGWIVSTWLLSCTPTRAGVSRSQYRRLMPYLIEALLGAARSRIVVACSEGNERTVHGWAVGESDGPLHYVYLPPELRGKGLAARLIGAALGTYLDRIEVTSRMPARDKADRRTSQRFVYEPKGLRRAA